MSEGIFINGTPLSEYLGKQKCKKLLKDASEEHKHTEKVPLYKKPQKVKCKTHCDSNGPVKIYSGRYIMQKNMEQQIKASRTLSERTIGVMMLGEFVNYQDIANKISKITGESVNFHSISGLCSTCSTVFKDDLEVLVPVNRKEGRKYRWVGPSVSLSEAYSRFKAHDKVKGIKNQKPLRSPF